jgi:ribonuclease Z
MPELIVLGTAASVPDAQHDTVGLVLRGLDWSVLVDCGGSPLHKLARVGVDLESIHAVILTHRHADHVYGFPMLVQGLWLSGRGEPLSVYGPAETLNVAAEMLNTLSLAEHLDTFALNWRPVPLREGRRIFRIGGVQITTAPTSHRQVPCVAVRFDLLETGRSLVYSADTEPCTSVIRLAHGADLLIHEATGAGPGHSSPAQAATVARKAGVRRLILTHYPVRGVDLDAWLADAAEFPGPVALAQDGDVYPL